MVKSVLKWNVQTLTIAHTTDGQNWLHCRNFKRLLWMWSDYDWLELSDWILFSNIFPNVFIKMVLE